MYTESEIAASAFINDFLLSFDEPYRKPIQSYVYCVWDVSREAAKIGFTADLSKHIGRLKTGNAEDFILLGCLPGGRETKKVWHRAFRAKRLNREWFDTSDGSLITAFLLAALEIEGGAA